MYYFNIILRSKCGSKYHKNKNCLALRATYHDISPQGTEKALGIYVTQCLKEALECCVAICYTLITALTGKCYNCLERPV